jgi:hypothetical protein
MNHTLSGVVRVHMADVTNYKLVAGQTGVSYRRWECTWSAIEE